MFNQLLINVHVLPAGRKTRYKADDNQEASVVFPAVSISPDLIIYVCRGSTYLPAASSLGLSMAVVIEHIERGLCHGGLTPACGSAHAHNDHEKYNVGKLRWHKSVCTAKRCTKVFPSVIKKRLTASTANAVCIV